MQNILIDTNTAEFIHIDLGKPLAVSTAIHSHTSNTSIHASLLTFSMPASMCMYTIHNYVFMYVKEKDVVAVHVLGREMSLCVCVVSAIVKGSPILQCQVYT